MLYLWLEGEPWRNSEVVALRVGGHGFKSKKQPLHLQGVTVCLPSLEPT